MPEPIWILTTTVETQKQANSLARLSIELNLAACAQVEAGITSHYRWKDRLEQTREYRIQFKLPGKSKERLVNWLHTNHPYDCPEILAWKADSCNPAYTEWINRV